MRSHPQATAPVMPCNPDTFLAGCANQDQAASGEQGDRIDGIPNVPDLKSFFDRQ